MTTTANSIIRKETWVNITVHVPSSLAKLYRKALIDSEVPSTQVLTSFIHAVARGEIRVAPRKDIEKPKRGLAYDTSGVFDDYRVLIKDHRGIVLNPMPFSNDFVEKF